MKTSKYVNKIDSQLNDLYNRINELKKDSVYTKHQHFKHTLNCLDNRIKALSYLPNNIITDKEKIELADNKKEFARVSTLFDLFLNEEV